MVDKKYPDSKEGAVQMLRDDTRLKLSDKPRGRSDPYVEGVWLISLDPTENDGNDCVIVYLAGYRDPFGRIRERNDFECGRR